MTRPTLVPGEVPRANSRSERLRCGPRRAIALGIAAAASLSTCANAVIAQEEEPAKPLEVAETKAPEKEPSRLSLSGTARSEAAVALNGPRLTKLRQYLYLSGSYAVRRPSTSGLAADLHFTMRGYFDGAHALTDQYPRRVRSDEQDEVGLREGVLNLTSERLSVQLGKQQTVWGEALALFFADVVNAKDYREFVLRDFTDIRIPVWAIDARYQPGGNRTLEVYWTPDVRFSRLPVRGAEFEFFRAPPPVGVPVTVKRASEPAVTIANSTRGFRYSQVWKGWDLAGFWLSALDDLPAVSKRGVLVGGVPGVSVSLLHPRLERYGATFSKPNGSGVWKGEFIYTTGRRFESRTVAPAQKRDELTAMAGATYPVSRYNIDAQVFHGRVMGDTAPLFSATPRTGLSLRVADDASLERLKPSILLVWSPNQGDFWVRPRIQYRIDDNTTLTVGFDWFGGGRATPFGQFRDNSRFEMLLSKRLF